MPFLASPPAPFAPLAMVDAFFLMVDMARMGLTPKTGEECTAATTGGKLALASLLALALRLASFFSLDFGV